MNTEKVETSNSSENQNIPRSSEISFWENKLAKTIWILVPFAVAGLILFSKYFVFAIMFAPVFPAGLAFNNGQLGMIMLIVGWAAYFSTAIGIYRSKNKTTITFLYFILVILIIINVAGCFAAGTEIS